MLQSHSMVLSGNNFFQWNQSAPPSSSHLCMTLEDGCSMSSHCCRSAPIESQLYKLYLATLGCYISLFAQELCQIPRRSLVASPFLLPRLPNLTCTFLQKHLHPLSPNPFGIIKIFQWQTVLKSLQKICNRHLPVQGAISQLFQMVLSQDNGPMHLLQKPSHPSFLPLVEGTNVGLPHPLGKLLQEEFHLLQADWGFAFGPTQVRQISDLIICIEFVIRNLW